MKHYFIFATCLLLNLSPTMLVMGVQFQGSKMIEPVVIAHGGAGYVTPSRHGVMIKGIQMAANTGYKMLINGGSSLDAVEAAVNYMENNGDFNAGYGSVLNLDGKVAMDASIQRGSDLGAGSVTLVKEFSNPISIARRVLEDSPHCMLGGEGVKRFAIKEGFEEIDPDSLITELAKEELEEFLKPATINFGIEYKSSGYHKNKGGAGTVGCVAIDSQGMIAVATSTGGLTGKYVGRIGDTPLIGSGSYADDLVGGVSSTGHGESIMKYCLAHSIIKLMESGESAQNATTKAVTSMTNRLIGTGGAITLSNKGDVGLHFTTETMPWSYIKSGKIHFGILPNQHYLEDFRMNG